MGNDRPKILVIDDQFSPREAVRMVLKNRYDVVTASGAIEGIEYMFDNPVNLVLLDIRMPRMDGIEAIKEIKMLFPETKIILFTAHANDIALEKALEHGAEGYITKPFDKDELLDMVHKTLLR
jgi:CheY-like chemotaxis protein